MTAIPLIRPSQSSRRLRFRANRPQEIWADMVSRPEDIADANALADSVMGDIRGNRLWTTAWWIATRTAYAAILKSSGRHIEESDYLAGTLGRASLSRADMAGLQRLYTFAHAGCSVVMGWDEAADRMVHFRCLDWPSAEAIARASRLYQAVDEDGVIVYRAAGILGLVGCLTAAKPGFSAAINFAPWRGPSLSPNPDPTFLLRELMESPAVTYDEARAAITRWRPSAPVFISLCGTHRDEACVLSFGAAWNRHRGCHVEEIGQRPWLVQTNHFDPGGPFGYQNKPWVEEDAAEWETLSLLQTSLARKEKIRKALFSAGDGLERSLRAIFAEPPVWNRQTAQWVTMIPATGEVRLEVRA